MKKRMLALLLCLCMAATFLPGTALAEEVTAETAVASVKIGDTTTYYETIGAAWTAATTAESAANEAVTVTLLKSTTATGTLTVPAGKSITYTSTEGAILSRTDMRCVFGIQGTLCIENATLNANYCIRVGDENADSNAQPAEVTISAGAKIAATAVGVECEKNGIVNIEDGGEITVTGGGPLENRTTGVSVRGGTIHVNGGKISSLMHGVSLSSGAHAEITGGAIEVNGNDASAILEGAIVGDGSDVAISGGTITVTNSNTSNGYGGVGVNVSTYGRKGNSMATITGGTIQAPNGVTVSGEGCTVTIENGAIIGTGENGSGLIVSSAGTANITDGTIRGGGAGLIVNQGGTANVAGGTITGTRNNYGVGMVVRGSSSGNSSSTAVLSGGTFTGTTYAIAFEEDKADSLSLKGLLKTEEGKTYAYFKDGKQISGNRLIGKALEGIITVQEGKKDANLTLTPAVDGKTVTLTLGGTAEILERVTVTGPEGITLTKGAGNTWSCTLPESGATNDSYSFVATFAGDDNVIGAKAGCTIMGDGESLGFIVPALSFRTMTQEEFSTDSLLDKYITEGRDTFAKNVSSLVDNLQLTVEPKFTNDIEWGDECKYGFRVKVTGTAKYQPTFKMDDEYYNYMLPIAIVYDGDEDGFYDTYWRYVHMAVGFDDDGTISNWTWTFSTTDSVGGEGRLYYRFDLSGITLEGNSTPTPDTPTTPSGGGSSGGSSTTTTTTKNPDGSTTTKRENKTTGTVTETTKHPDGSQVKVETKKDGTVTTTATDKDGNKSETVAKPDGSAVTTVKQKDGAAATVTTDTAGKTQAEVTLPRTAVSAAQKSGEAIALPIPAVKAAATTEAAPEVRVKTGSSEPVKVEIPTAKPAPGAVAVLVKADGTEEIVKSSYPTETGVAVTLPDGAAVKLVDKGKTFADVPADNWAADAVAFTSARDLFQGTSETTFDPDLPMTRAMLMTVLARYDGQDTEGGETWYEKSVAWAVANGINDGIDPGKNVTREEMAVMFWRYAGSPAAEGTLEGFQDADSVSSGARAAMSWAVEKGIIRGYETGELVPQGQATRAQVAQILQNFISAR